MDLNRGVDHLLPYINMFGSVIFLQNLTPSPPSPPTPVPRQLNGPAEVRNATPNFSLPAGQLPFFWRQLPDSSTERLNTQELLAHMFSTHTIKEAGLYRMKLTEKSERRDKAFWVRFESHLP